MFKKELSQGISVKILLVGSNDFLEQLLLSDTDASDMDEWMSFWTVEDLNFTILRMSISK